MGFRFGRRFPDSGFRRNVAGLLVCEKLRHGLNHQAWKRGQTVAFPTAAETIDSPARVRFFAIVGREVRHADDQ